MGEQRRIEQRRANNYRVYGSECMQLIEKEPGEEQHIPLFVSYGIAG